MPLLRGPRSGRVAIPRILVLSTSAGGFRPQNARSSVGKRINVKRSTCASRSRGIAPPAPYAQNLAKYSFRPVASGSGVFVAPVFPSVVFTVKDNALPAMTASRNAVA